MNYDYCKEIGKNIGKIRQEQNMTQEQLVARLQIEGCDLTRSALSKIEIGQRSVYPDEMKALKQALKVSYDDLFV